MSQSFFDAFGAGAPTNIPFSPFDDVQGNPGAAAPLDLGSFAGFGTDEALQDPAAAQGGFFKRFPGAPEEFELDDFLDILGLVGGLVQGTDQARLNDEFQEDVQEQFRQTLAGIQQRIQDIQQNSFSASEREAAALTDPDRAGVQRQSQAAQAQRLAQGARERQSQDAARRGTTFSGQSQENAGAIDQQLAEALLGIQANEAQQGRNLQFQVDQNRQNLLAPLFAQMARLQARRPIEQRTAQGINPFTMAGAKLGGIFGGSGGALLGGGIGEVAGRLFG